ncbi:MAG TPA: pantetheine-phosphate adenylyltransferase [Vicinamibacterales bacterium]|nr:pantetheine-phosphate adenylyltransferase [Vicinamibacterales bacterium]
MTNGHVDVVERSLRLFDRVIVSILVNAEKKPLFSPDERVEIAREVFARHSGVEVATFNGLLVEFARQRGAAAIIRGLRSVSDFDYEMQMALMNRHLRDEIETVFLMPSERFTYVSSRLVKEVAALGGSIVGLVPDTVAARLAQRQSPATTRKV